METLYDLLGALPNDGADDLRAAFRRAVKQAHPDVNPEDPDAELKLRRIVRANEILGDAEQRVAYDRLLELANVEHERATKRAVADMVHKLASGLMVVAGASIGAVGGYALFVQLSASALAPGTTTGEPAAILAAGSAGEGPASASAASLEASGHADVTASAIEPATRSTSNDTAETAPGRVQPSPDRSLKRAPKFAATYSDRSIMLDGLRQFARAFAELAPASAFKERTAPPRHGRKR